MLPLMRTNISSKCASAIPVAAALAIKEEDMDTNQMLIGGRWVEAAGGATFETENPFLGAAWALVPRGTRPMSMRAVEAAHKAFRDKSWRELTASARGALLRKLGDLIAAEAAHLAEIETTDNGKLHRRDARPAQLHPAMVLLFGGLADKIEGRVIPIDKPGVFNFTRDEPLGVVAAITPWNSPLLLAAWKLAPALRPATPWCGSRRSSPRSRRWSSASCSRRPAFRRAWSTSSPASATRSASRWSRIPRVAKVAFTGGDRTGQSVYELAARGIKPVTLELGGKSANIVFDDAELDDAVKGVVSGIFAATGQTCIAGSRALVQRSIHDALRRAAAGARQDRPDGRSAGH